MAENSLRFHYRRISLVHKLILLVVFSIFLQFTDSKIKLVNNIRNSLITIIYPIIKVISLPAKGLDYLIDIINEKNKILNQNSLLEKKIMSLTTENNILKSHQTELLQLKKIHQLIQLDIGYITVAEVISSFNHSFSDKIMINKGSLIQVKAGQAVVDENGLIGEIVSVQKNTAEVQLLQYTESIIPVTVARTGFNTLIYGDKYKLDLKYFPLNEDLKEGDVLVTSGLDSNFPRGIPVATVSKINLSKGTPYYNVEAFATSKIGRSRFVLVLPLTNDIK